MWGVIVWIFTALPAVRGAAGDTPAVPAPDSAVSRAAADLARLPADIRPLIRYLWLSSPEKDRKDWLKVLNFHVNQLSSEPDIQQLAVVAPDLLRLNVVDYAWDRTVWEKLGEGDPYFHVKLTGEARFVSPKPERTFTKRDGTLWFSDGERWFSEAEWQAKRIRVPAISAAPWLPEREIRALIQGTASQSPILTGEWFFYRTAIQTERDVNNPGYYQFLGVKDQKSFEKLIGHNAKTNPKFLRELREAVAISGIARQSRRIERIEKVGGGYWRTFDNRLAVEDRNPLRILNGKFKYDASEVFAHLPNGLWAMALWNSKGELQDNAPDFVGFDHTSTSNDGRINVPLSCIRCHSKAGLQNIHGWVRNLVRPPLALQSPDYARLKVLKSQYLRLIDPFLAADRLRHATAVYECNGLDPQSNARLFGQAWMRYADTPLDLEAAARELGVSKETFRKALFGYNGATGASDTVLSMYLRPEKDQEGIPREQWLEAYPVAQLVIKGLINK